MNELHEFIAKVVEARAALIEEACEKAVQTDVCGVSVWSWMRDNIVLCFDARVDPTVPYGYIHEHPFGKEPPC